MSDGKYCCLNVILGTFTPRATSSFKNEHQINDMILIWAKLINNKGKIIVRGIWVEKELVNKHSSKPNVKFIAISGMILVTG